jgi:hypothetical protein
VARTVILTLGVLLMTAAPAFASGAGHDGGEGWYGLTNDKIITNAGFLIIAGIPLLILLLSLLQHTLDKRKARRKAAAKGRASAPQWRGGW